MAIGDRMALPWRGVGPAARSFVWRGRNGVRDALGSAAERLPWKKTIRLVAVCLYVAAVVCAGAAIAAATLLDFPHTVNGILVLSTLAVFGFPLVSVGYSYMLSTANTRGYTNCLEELNHSLDRANLGLLETLGAVMDAYDVYTFGHSTQVTVYADALAEQLGLSHLERDAIVKAALIHDIGKIGVLDSIIGKEGPLTDQEYEMVKRHPILSAEIIGRMSALRDLGPLVRGHHERWDGRGYPDALQGEEIPRGARVLALADALDALCSDRPYRPTRSLAEVVSEVKACSGQHFDPAVVSAFLHLVEKRGGGFFVNSALKVNHLLSTGAVVGVSAPVRYFRKGMICEERMYQ